MVATCTEQPVDEEIKMIGVVLDTPKPEGEDCPKGLSPYTSGGSTYCVFNPSQYRTGSVYPFQYRTGSVLDQFKVEPLTPPPTPQQKYKVPTIWSNPAVRYGAVAVGAIVLFNLFRG